MKKTFEGKLEVGKTYKTMCGEIVTIIQHNASLYWPFFDNFGCAYQSNGESYHGTFNDIIEEA